MSRPRLDLDAYVSGVRACDRAVLARAITLVESSREDDQTLAQELLQRLLPATGEAWRVGITGTPGVGKSTFIEALGMMLVERGHRVAVLAVDPSSRISGGSILGDKSRMARLAQHPRAFIRPSPSAQSLGGVARRTRETMILCEAAGHDVVLVETVGVGQSEVAVAEMVDFFLLLMQPGAGDELQGIKKGVVEMADLIAINKADGDNLPRAREAARAYGHALRYLRPRRGFKARAVMVSALTGEGLDALWEVVTEHHEALEKTGDLDALRRDQRERWMWALVEEELLTAFRESPGVRGAIAARRADVVEGRLTPTQGARALLEAFRHDRALAT